MTTSNKPIIHGRDHGPGGADPLSSSGAASGDTIVADGSGGIAWAPGGGAGAKHLLAVWGGTMPNTTGPGQVWRVPYNPEDGSSYTFSLVYAFARLEDTVGAAVTFRIESSPGSGAFSATTVTTLTISAGAHEHDDSTLASAVSSGQLLRINFIAVSGATVYDVELTGHT